MHAHECSPLGQPSKQAIPPGAGGLFVNYLKIKMIFEIPNSPLPDCFNHPREAGVQIN